MTRISVEVLASPTQVLYSFHSRNFNFANLITFLFISGWSFITYIMFNAKMLNKAANIYNRQDDPTCQYSRRS